MKIFKPCILVVAVITAASGLMGCNQKSHTLTSITVTPANQSMAKGTTQQFTAYATLSDGTTLAWSQVVTWSSSNTAVATVSNTAGSNGLVTAVDLDYGTPVIITALDPENNISGTAMLTVTNPESISILPANPYMSVGATHQFAAIASFPNGTATQVITSSATWTIPPAVATVVYTPGVAGNGYVTAGANPGTTIIRANDPVSGVTGTTTLTVTSTPLTSIAIDQINPIISMSTTTLQQFTAIGTFQDGSTTQTLAPNVTASWAWSSSNTGVATIDYYTGLAHAVAPGTATITATDPITDVSGNTTLTFQ